MTDPVLLPDSVGRIRPLPSGEGPGPLQTGALVTER
jgi:hypothetical protein